MSLNIKSLQDRIDSNSNGNPIVISFGEFNENLIIKKPVSISGGQAPITVVAKSPTVRINSKKVELRNLEIICSDEGGIAIDCKTEVPFFDNVFIKGQTKGFDEGRWELPEKVLELKASTECIVLNRLLLVVPVHCFLELPSQSDVKLKTTELQAGMNEVLIEIDQMMPNNFLFQEIIVRQKCGLKRKIPFTAHPTNTNSKFENSFLVWESKSASKYIAILGRLQNLTPGYANKFYQFDLSFLLDGDKDVDIEVKGNNDFKIRKLSDRVLLQGQIQEESEILLNTILTIYSIKFSSQLIIPVIKQSINPLNVEYPQVNSPLVEKEHFTLDCKIISSNSVDLYFELVSDSIPNVQINPVTGQLYGTFEKYGVYHANLKITDGTVTNDLDLELKVVPKEKLTVHHSKFLNLSSGELIKIKININDSSTLAPKISVVQHGIHGSLKLLPDKSDFLLSAEFTEFGEGYIEIIVTDIFDRSYIGSIHIKVSDKPIYRFVWKTTQFKPEKGVLGKSFEYPLEILVYKSILGKEEIIHDAKLQFILISTSDSSFTLDQHGIIHGLRRDESVILRIRLMLDEQWSEETITIHPIIATNSLRVVNPDKISWNQKVEKVEIEGPRELKEKKITDKKSIFSKDNAHSAGNKSTSPQKNSEERNQGIQVTNPVAGKAFKNRKILDFNSKFREALPDTIAGMQIKLSILKDDVSDEEKKLILFSVLAFEVPTGLAVDSESLTISGSISNPGVYFIVVKKDDQVVGRISIKVLEKTSGEIQTSSGKLLKPNKLGQAFLKIKRGKEDDEN